MGREAIGVRLMGDWRSKPNPPPLVVSPIPDPKGRMIGTIRLPEPHVIEAMKRTERFDRPASS